MVKPPYVYTAIGGGSGLHTPVCDAVTDNGISVPQELYEQVLRLCT
ncbi:hypothetical protein VPHD281_0097 [Vibrio phage D281]